MSQPSFTDFQRHASQGAARARRARAMPCPHCSQPLRIRYSQMQSPTCRQGGMECQNADCGWRGSFTFALDATHVESATPHPRVNLPLSEHARRRMESALAADDARRVGGRPRK